MWLSANDIAAGTGLALGSVYRLASIHKWRKTKTRPRSYWSEDVIKSLGQAT